MYTLTARRCLAMIGSAVLTAGLFIGSTIAEPRPGSSASQASSTSSTLSTASGSTIISPEHDDGRWLGSWNASMTLAGGVGTISGDGFADTTLLQSVHMSIGGESLRVRLANTYGTGPLEVGAVTVAGGTPVTFHGSEQVTIPAGAEWISDEVPVNVEPNSDLDVRIYLPGPTGPATTHPLGMATSYRADGNQTAGDESVFVPLDESRYFLSGVDVTSTAKSSTVFFGDSITDGRSSTVDANLRYPDQVADQLLQRPTEQQCGVLNSGISGNRLLENAGMRGASALARFDRDVLARQGVGTVVLLEGINDIGMTWGEVSVGELISLHQQLINRAHDHGLRVVGATLTPYRGASYFTETGEKTRQALNEWIRTSGAYDDVVDFDEVIRDTENPEVVSPSFDPGDHLHPNDAGYTAMADAVDLDLVC
ncbi:MAG TPA: SGNH/GDSL hydrolase family protein [Candidatus Corynebacterium avicola]|uniref:SGNH/GDSL hydrolase family protein n=1 Tax=Candidatus Corynebacterium avicola TaxID=2838527 RepID=A0A9D1RPJ5_9CORY|nr:SGNH/GDSL hydrolase family protein [Candidatus Corynebacterium avicola]